ncbi:hypothetical protein [Cupriavidus agavae]|uniref:Uncharacterized protein n=1 Tax=Cupriavidus agavae TaxID=1001822 RepID=A0A4Q7RIN6_9BURK|nr:hypothetical protein [Cupriavidus agavae]RZT31782.1 hypothetical protein EV147_4281 [Cupriavidus agavae]
MNAPDTHDGIVQLYASQIIDHADAAQAGAPVSALAMASVDKAMMHFRTLDGGRATATLLQRLGSMLRAAALAPGRLEPSRLVLIAAADYAANAARGFDGTS